MTGGDEAADVLVVGGGISGASFAYFAARSGKRVRVLEREPRPGGCLCSVRDEADHWFELGAHTCYNSYGALLELLEGVGLIDQLQARGKPELRFLGPDGVRPGKNLRALLGRMGKLELVGALARRLWPAGRGTAERTVREHYGAWVGPNNYRRALGPMLSAVPSQSADDFPATMLFKRRPRRPGVMRSFTLPGGLQRIVEAVADLPQVELVTDRTARRLERTPEGFRVEDHGGQRHSAARLCLALPPGAACGLLEASFPDLASGLAELGEARVRSVGVTLPRDASPLPSATFLIPEGDLFHSVVTRDPVPDPRWRSFTFHFRPEVPAGPRAETMARVLGVASGALGTLHEREHVLPSPTLGHAGRIGALQQRLLGVPGLALGGNWFAGLSIEDCVQRSRAEWRRLAT